MTKPQKPPLGFSLIELMIVVAIVAILATIAYPSYTDYIRRGKIAEATSAMADYRVRLEQYYQDNRNYGSTTTACGVANPSTPSFAYACVSGDGTNQTFVLTATGNAANGVGGIAYTLDQNNSRQTTAFPGVTGTKPCWISRAADSC